MKSSLVKALAFAALLGAAGRGSAATVYQNDFSSEKITTAYNIYYGGWFGSNATPGELYRGDTTLSITPGGELQASANYGHLSVGVLLLPSAFQATGAGSYVLTFDVKSVSDFDSNDVVAGSVWSAKGYGPSNTGDALFLSFGTSEVVAQGSASASKIGSVEQTSPGTYSVPFTYDGSSAIAFFLGINTKGWAAGMPVARFDNVSISTVAPSLPSSAVPEVSGSLGLGLLIGTGLLRRSRKG